MGRKTKWVGVLFCVFVITLLLSKNISERLSVSDEMKPQGRTVSEVFEQTETGLQSIRLFEENQNQTFPGSGPPSDQNPVHASDHDKSYVEHEILVQFAPQLSKDEIVTLLNALEMSIEQILNSKNLCRIRLPESLNVKDALKIFKEVPDILFSEPNYLIRTTEPNSLIQTTDVPDDSSFSNQWGFHNTGNKGGTVDADIDAPEAWDKVTGSSTVIVAVVDEGVDINHEDLSSNIWVNTGEIAGNGIDDDDNGLIDDVNGWDFNHNDATVYDAANEDRHGTQVAGIIGAVGDNNKGTAGVCWNVRVMPVKFIASGSGTVSNAILALNYAAANGAKIINCSWGGTSYSASLKAAFTDVMDAGVLVVASAGNSSKDTDSNSHYPSNYDLANILSVAATDRNDELSYFSNYGLTTVDLGAPGSSIYTTSPDQKYSNFSGTSAAAPFVSGAAALALSAEPNQTALELKDQILNSVDPLDELTTVTATGGRLNLNNLITALSAGDRDGDGLPNSYESQYGLNPNDPSDAENDPDGDELTNLQEFSAGTDPTLSDTDGDGLPDGYEVGHLLDPTSDADGDSDKDEDGLSNLLEYQTGTRLDLSDTDGDGIDDFTEYGSSETAADSDGDTIYDVLDPDSDNDGKSDAEEGIGDDDDDGISNYVDMNDADGPTADQDGDGLTNSLEVTHMLSPNLADSDGDGIDDRTEFGDGDTPRNSDGDEPVDALDLDSDNDGKTDASEGTGDQDGDEIPNYRDSNDQDGAFGDSDGDGLTNQLEASYGMNINLADSDGDHISDSTEFGPGNTPLDSDGDGVIDPLDTDSDGDGALDKNEENGDIDGDGTPDRLDRDSATVKTGYGNLSLMLNGGKGELKNVQFLAQAISESSHLDYDFSHGGFEYQVSGLDPGESVQLIIRSPADLPENTEFWKYVESEGYYSYPASVNGRNLEFTLTDGEIGDDDGVANGTIVDPGYIVVPVEAADTSAPAASGGGGGSGGGGCSMSRTDQSLEDGWMNLVILLLPLVILSIIRFIAICFYPRARSMDRVS